LKKFLFFGLLALCPFAFSLPATAENVSVRVQIGNDTYQIGGKNCRPKNRHHRNRTNQNSRQDDRGGYDGYYNSPVVNSNSGYYNQDSCYAVDQNGNQYPMNCGNINNNGNRNVPNINNNGNNQNTNSGCRPYYFQGRQVSCN
jgi:hypothetical protein